MLLRQNQQCTQMFRIICYETISDPQETNFDLEKHRCKCNLYCISHLTKYKLCGKVVALIAELNVKFCSHKMNVNNIVIIGSRGSG